MPLSATSVAGEPSLIDHAFQAPRLVNLERSYDIMDKYNLRALVAATPTNIYYLTSHSGIMQWMGRHFSSFAVLPRDEDLEPSYIMHGSMLYHFDYRPTWVENIRPVSSPLKDEEGQTVLRADGDPQASPKIGMWATRSDVPLKRGDLIQKQLFDKFADRTVSSTIHGLKDVVIEICGGKGRIGFDDPRLGSWLKDVGVYDVEAVDAINIFKEIRMVKTPNEIEILREAAQLNEQALDYAISKIEPGQELIEIERNHGVKWNELGGRSRWLIANVNGVNSGTAEVGDFMKLDSVGVYKGYNGDIGRTVCLGDPPDELVRRIEANYKVSRYLYDYIRPGMYYIDIFNLFGELMKNEGVGVAFAGPHDVGLEHTDHFLDFGAADVPGSMSYDKLQFHDNTVFTLDMPHNELGWGTTHVEDMLLVTNQGCELLSSGDTSLRVI